MKIGTLAKQNMLIASKSHKSGSLRQKKQQKLTVKKRCRFRKAMLYEREVMKQQNIFYSPAEASILIQHVVRQS
jgi:hypothetical protein